MVRACTGRAPTYAVKVPCFSFEKLADVDTHLGPEMKSTGEVLGIGTNLQEAIYKGMVAAGYKMKHTGGLLVTVRDQDKQEAVDTARKFAELGFNLFATPGTAKVLLAHGLYAATVRHDMMEKMLEMDQVQYVISTSSHGRQPQLEDVRMRRKAVERGIRCSPAWIPPMPGQCSDLRYTLNNVELVDINDMRTSGRSSALWKMPRYGQ